MSKKVKMEFISSGFHDILCSDGVAKEVQAAANTIGQRADSNAKALYPGTRGHTYQNSAHVGFYGGGRVIAHVTTIDMQAALAEAKAQTLSKAVG
jgi:hypothetical protein